MTSHVLCVYTPMHCVLSCICLCHVLVCAGGVLTSVLQFFTVLVQQGIAGITFDVLFEVRRHQHISTFTNLRMILQMYLYSWHCLIIPLFSSFSYAFVSLFCSFISFCPFCPVLSLLFSTSSLPSPRLPSFPPSSPKPVNSLLAASTIQRRPNSRSHRALQLQDW